MKRISIILFLSIAFHISGSGQTKVEEPYIALNYIICMQGDFPSRTGSNTGSSMLGEVKIFAGNFAPAGWAFCEGQLIAISSNTALFSILGTTYGGDGRTTFALPDLRGRVAIQQGTGPGLEPVQLGEKGGS